MGSGVERVVSSSSYHHSSPHHVMFSCWTSSLSSVKMMLMVYVLMTVMSGYDERWSSTGVTGLSFGSLISGPKINLESSKFHHMIQSSAISASDINSGSSSSSSSYPSIPCDYETYENTGCEDDEGSYCDTETQKCLCREGYPIRLMGYCLSKKQIGQDCYTSSQCNSIANAACFIFGKEYDNERISGGHNVGRQLSNWPTGNCKCHIGYQLDNTTTGTTIDPMVDGTKPTVGISSSDVPANFGRCIKKTVGSWCTDDWDCIKEMFNTQCSRPQNLCECSWGYYYDVKSDSCQIPKLFGSKCTSTFECSAESLICSPNGRCICPKGFHFDVIHPGCKPNDDSSCDFGYKWDEEWGRCIPASRSGSGAAAPFNQISSSTNTNNNNNGKSGSSGSNKNHIHPTGTTSSGSDNTSSTSSNSSSSFSVKTALFLIIPNIIGFALVFHYCYQKKDGSDDESNDGLEDVTVADQHFLRAHHRFLCGSGFPYYHHHHHHPHDPHDVPHPEDDPQPPVDESTDVTADPNAITTAPPDNHDDITTSAAPATSIAIDGENGSLPPPPLDIKGVSNGNVTIENHQHHEKSSASDGNEMKDNDKCTKGGTGGESSNKIDAEIIIMDGDDKKDKIMRRKSSSTSSSTISASATVHHDHHDADTGPPALPEKESKKKFQEDPLGSSDVKQYSNTKNHHPHPPLDHYHHHQQQSGSRSTEDKMKNGGDNAAPDAPKDSSSDGSSGVAAAATTVPHNHETVKNS